MNKPTGTGVPADFSEFEKTLPLIPEAVGNYFNCVRTGNLLFLSGKGPLTKPGVVGRDMTKEQAYECARETGLMLIAVLKQELGDLSRVAGSSKSSGW